MVDIVQVPGYHKMTIHPNDAAVCENRGTPNSAVCVIHVLYYGGIGVVCAKYPGTPAPITDRTGPWTP